MNVKRLFVHLYQLTKRTAEVLVLNTSLAVFCWPDMSIRVKSVKPYQVYLLTCRVHRREHWKYEHEALSLFEFKNVPVKTKERGGLRWMRMREIEKKTRVSEKRAARVWSNRVRVIIRGQVDMV